MSGRGGGGGGGRGGGGGGRGRGGGGGGRGRGRAGGGGGQGQGGGYQQSPGPSQGRGGGTGGRGRGISNAGPSGYVAPTQPSAPGHVSMPSSSTASLSEEFQQKVAVGSSSSTPAPVAAPVTAEGTSSQQTVEPSATIQTEQTAPVSSKALRAPIRPQLGTVGRKCVIKANHFVVEVADKDLHHYDVTITPEVASKKVCRDILCKLVELYRESHMGLRLLAYDGKKSAYTAGQLPFESKEFVVKLDEKDSGPRREREFKVNIRFAAKPDIEHLREFLKGRQHDAPQETIQALDVVLRATPSINYEVVGRAFFKPIFGYGPLGDGLDYWKGFYQSLRPTQMGLSLNVDTSARAFYQPILVSEFVSQSLRKDISRPLSDQDRVKIKKVLKGLKVETRHTKYVKSQKVTGLSTQPLNALTFTDATGARISVVQYFQTKYNISLKYPLLPAIQVGTEARPTYLPMEICCIKEGQRYTRKLNEKQVTSMLNATCNQPRTRESEIEKMVTSNGYTQDKVANEFGIKLSPEMVSIDARVLPPPPIKYHASGKESLVNPSVGQWNMINKKMFNGGTVDVWACVNFSRHNDHMVNNFCYELGSMCTSKGMAFNPQPLLPIWSAHAGQIEKALYEIHSEVERSKKQLDLLIVILPEVSGQYGKIKRMCETELGIVSQCCQPKNVPRCNKQYLENVSLKINVKVGGENSVLLHAFERRIPYLTDRPTIIFGADVTHPQPGEDSSSSIAAVVASMNWPAMNMYRGLVSAQPHRQEIIQNLYQSHTDPVKGVVHSGMVRELLIEYYKKSNCKPHRLIFYRDGVSEGQFNQVLMEELIQIQKACVSLEDRYMPYITFVVVQKRHHTRLFPANHNDRNLTDKSGNILPGTVVDTRICHPTEFDFYLCSHAGIKGTSRPTHYHVLYDANNFTADGLQMLTNNLCYTYARCTRSVSVVPAVYYAHLAAFRARYYVEGEVSESNSAGDRAGAGAGGATRDQPAPVRPLPRIMDNVKKVMFYC